jgi:hypothetical protein
MEVLQMMNKMSSITFPDGSSYEVTDDKARKDITELNNSLDTTNENFGEIKLWTPNGQIQHPQRNYYIKTKNTIKIWFCFYINSEINATNNGYILSNNPLSTFGLSSINTAWTRVNAILIGTTWEYKELMLNCVNNVLKLEYYGQTIPVNSLVSGFIEIGING